MSSSPSLFMLLCVTSGKFTIFSFSILSIFGVLSCNLCLLTELTAWISSFLFLHSCDFNFCCSMNFLWAMMSAFLSFLMCSFWASTFVTTISTTSSRILAQHASLKNISSRTSLIISLETFRLSSTLMTTSFKMSLHISVSTNLVSAENDFVKEEENKKSSLFIGSEFGISNSEKSFTVLWGILHGSWTISAKMLERLLPVLAIVSDDVLNLIFMGAIGGRLISGLDMSVSGSFLLSFVLTVTLCSASSSMSFSWNFTPFFISTSSSNTLNFNLGTFTLQFKDLSLFAKPLRVGSISGWNGDVITFTGLYAQFLGPCIRLVSLIRSLGIGSCWIGANSGVLGISGVELRLSAELLSDSLELLELELELLWLLGDARFGDAEGLRDWDLLLACNEGVRLAEGDEFLEGTGLW